MGNLEQWKKIPGYNDYEASNFGRIRSTNRVRRDSIGRMQRRTGEILKQGITIWGYYKIGLYHHGNQETLSVHRLIAATWLGICQDGQQVNHKDGDKTNNHVDNLEYVSASENIQHAFKIGLRQDRGENHRDNKLTESCVKDIRESYSAGNISQQTLADQCGVSQGTISKIIRGKRWGWLA